MSKLFDFVFDRLTVSQILATAILSFVVAVLIIYFLKITNDGVILFVAATSIVSSGLIVYVCHHVYRHLYPKQGDSTWID